MSKVKYGILHCHTHNSIRDSVMTVKQLVDRAKELGAPAVALTDHGSMTGYVDFMSACEEEEIKPILGVEAYVEEQSEGRKHLILMAKDYVGFVALIKAVSESNTRLVKLKSLSFPRMNKEILTKYFGPGSAGHGHVIATSACVSGVLANLLITGKGIEKEIAKLREKQTILESPDSTGYQKNKNALEAQLESQKRLLLEIADLKKKAAKSSTMLEKKVSAAKTAEDKIAAADALAQAERCKAEASEALKRKQEEKELLDSKIKTLRPIVNQCKTSIQRWEKIQEKINELSALNTPADNVDELLREEALWYQNNFGVGNFYIELQYHGLPDERKVMPKLAALSDVMEIPVCIANDAHIPTKTGDDILARAIIRATAFDKWDAPTNADKELYLKTDEDLIKKLCEVIPEKKVLEGYENIGKIVSECDLKIPKGNHYPKFTTPDGTSTADYLRKITYERISNRYSPEEFTEEYRARMEYELDIIIKMGYADYHLIVEDLLCYARAAGKLYLDNPEEEALALSFDVEAIENYTKNRAGECVGPGRGSAAGSIVCYIIGITNIDPMKYGLLFERFLNPERITMPDVDCDIESNVRPYVILYARHRYGRESVCGIMTHGSNAGKAAIRNAARVLGMQRTNESTTYLKYVNEIWEKAAGFTEDELQISLVAMRPKLEEAFKSNATAIEIIHYAILIEGSYSNIGQHAAGIIITDGRPVDEYVPLIYNTKNQIMMTQCDMEQVEMLGLLKVDFLGLNNLTIITDTVREIQKRYNILIDMDHIPFEKEIFKEIFAKGMTNSIFQFESEGMKKMLRNFRPESIFDLVQLVAMYRPGPMQYLSKVIAVKNGRQKPTYLIPQLKPILEKTYGSITYQEQVQEIFKQLAGYSLGQADLVRRAMSKKKKAVLEAERHAFLYGDEKRNIPGCLANQISEPAADKLFDETMYFSKYAFNKSHAACYAVVAYQTAYLKYHYPLEYMKSVLNVKEFENIAGLVSDIRKMQVGILAPDINNSELQFTIFDDKILYGLGVIKGLGNSVQEVIQNREEFGPYQSIGDFVGRVLPSKKVLEAFTEAGVFDSFCSNRGAILNLLSTYLKVKKSIKDYQKKLDEAYEPKKIQTYQNKLSQLRKQLTSLQPDEEYCEDPLERLNTEKKLIGAYISGHPLDLYPAAIKCGAVDIEQVLDSYAGTTVNVIGIISDLAIRKKGKVGADIGFFNLSDKTGEIGICCFTEAYAKWQPYIQEDAVVKITGKLMRDKFDETRLKIAVDSVKPLSPLKNTVIVFVKDIDDWEQKVKNLIKPYVSRNGNPVRVYDLFLDEYRTCDLLVAPSIVNDGIIHAKMQEMRI